jgi:penicillin-binding protein 2
MRRIWEALYGIDGTVVRPAAGLIPGGTPPPGLPRVDASGLITAPDGQRRRRGGRRW